MRVVAAVRTFGLCGTKKCPFEFATEGVSPGSEKRAAKCFFSWFLNETEFELRNELTWHV